MLAHTYLLWAGGSEINAQENPSPSETTVDSPPRTDMSSTLLEHEFMLIENGLRLRTVRPLIAPSYLQSRAVSDDLDDPDNRPTRDT